jgi:integrase
MQHFLTDVQELKKGLIIFRRADVQHKNWYCRVKVPGTSLYKTISLKTSDINEAKDKAFDHDSDIRFRVRHQVPVFDKSFADVAKEYSYFQKRVADIGQITMHRWKTVDGHIRLHLVPYMGNVQITSITEDKWTEYPFWRKENNAIRKPQKRVFRKKPKAGALPDAPADAEQNKKDGPAKNGTIRQEMMTFRAIMNFAAGKHYIRESQVPKGGMPEDKNRRDEFTPQEYRQLHTFARDWIRKGDKEINIWYRTMAYNFMLIMANTGMRTGEARSLRWRDIDMRKTRDGRPFVTLNVRGKGKYRELIAAGNVATYLDRIKAISKATKPDDPVFTTAEGKTAKSLYDTLIADLLTKSGLLYGASGTRRSGYCFRHTYATYRLMEGIDVYFLAKQMGTSVKMIEDYYGHITPAKNAERILQGIPGWEPIAEGSGEPPDSVNAGAANSKSAKPRTKK